jgi:phage terminase small subunit
MNKGETKELLTPRQIEFVTYWLDEDSETKGNAYKSALKAGYVDATARKITSQLPDKVIKEVNKRIEEKLGVSGDEIVTNVVEKLDRIMNSLENMKDRKKYNIDVKDVLKAIELLGKYKKLFTDRIDISGEPVVKYVISRE